MTRARSIASSIAALLAVPLIGVGATLSTSSASDVDWQTQLLPDSQVDVSQIPDLQRDAMREANEMFVDAESVWAQSHYGADGGVVVNLKVGWEEVVGGEVDLLMSSATVPVTVRAVEHSAAELMASAKFGDPIWESDFAGARAVSVALSPEENKLVIGLTVVNEGTVEAAQDVFGPDVLFTQGEAAESAESLA